MCSDCFKGLAVSPEELAGETGDAGLARNLSEYFLHHRTQIYERRRAAAGLRRYLRSKSRWKS